MPNTTAGWHDGGTAAAVAGAKYVAQQLVLKQRFRGTGSENLAQLEQAINAQSALGYRLHTMSTAPLGSAGFRIQATMIFEKIS